MHNPMMKKMAPATTPVVAGAGAPAAVGGDDLDLPGIAALLRAHWPSVLAVMGATLLLGLLLALLKQPEYVSTGVISVAEPPAIGARTKGKTPRADPRSGGRDVALLRSRRLAVRVLQALATSSGREESPVAISSGRVSRFLGRLKVSQAPGSSVITISYRAGSPREAARTVNQVIDSFRELKGEQVAALFNSEKRYVDSEIQRRRDELAAVQRRIDEFRKANGLADDVSVSVKARQVGTLDGQLALAQAQAEKAAARWRHVEALIRAGDMAAVGAAVDSPLVRHFREKEVALQNRISEMRNEYGPRHPKLIDAQTQLAELRASIERELRYLARTMKNDVAAEQRRVRALQQGIDRLEEEIARAQTAGGGLKELELEAEAIREQFRELLKRAKTLDPQARELAVAKLVSVISPGYEPGGPVFPTRKQILSLAVAAALLLGLLAAFLAEYFNPKLTRPRAWRPPTAPALAGGRAPAALAAGAGVASGRPAPAAGNDDLRLIPLRDGDGSEDLAVVPIPGDGAGIVPATEVAMKQRSRFAGAIARLNDRLLARLRNGGPKVVLVTGSHGIGDKVSVAAALAVLNARQGRRVVLVDLSRGEAEVHRAFGMSPSPGLAEIIARSTTLTRAFQTDFRSHVTLLTRGEFVDNRLAKRLVDVAPSLMLLLKKYFDLIFVVTRNIEVATEAEIFADRIDQALAVVSPPSGSREARADAVIANPRLRRLRSRLLPVVVRR